VQNRLFGEMVLADCAPPQVTKKMKHHYWRAVSGIYSSKRPWINEFEYFLRALRVLSPKYD